MGSGADPVKVVTRNRRARHDYHVLDTLEAGVVLRGTEVKAIRGGHVQLKDSYVEIREGEAWLVGAHISPYSHGNQQNHPPERPRKLLLQRRQIERLQAQVTMKGMTVIPLSVYLKGHLVKVELGLARGKKLYDKRAAEKEKVLEQEAREAVARR